MYSFHHPNIYQFIERTQSIYYNYDYNHNFNFYNSTCQRYANYEKVLLHNKHKHFSLDSKH